MLCYAMLCYAMLCYAMLWYAILILYYTILYYTILYYTILYYTLYYSTLCYSARPAENTLLCNGPSSTCCQVRLLPCRWRGDTHKGFGLRPSLRTRTLDLGGFDSGRVSILRDGLIVSVGSGNVESTNVTLYIIFYMMYNIYIYIYI